MCHWKPNPLFLTAFFWQTSRNPSHIPLSSWSLSIIIVQWTMYFFFVCHLAAPHPWTVTIYCTGPPTACLIDETSFFSTHAAEFGTDWIPWSRRHVLRMTQLCLPRGFVVTTDPLLLGILKNHFLWFRLIVRSTAPVWRFAGGARPKNLRWVITTISISWLPGMRQRRGKLA